jgi:hypothetical protein
VKAALIILILLVANIQFALDICKMKFKNETIYKKAKQLRELINEADGSSAYEDTYLREKLLKLSMQIPIRIGLSLNLHSIDDVRSCLEEAQKKLIELYVVVDLFSSEHFQLDWEKSNSLMEEINDLIPITLENAEEEAQKRMDEMMKEFMVEGA